MVTTETSPNLPPKYSSPVSVAEMRAGDGARCIAFMQRRCRVTKTSIGGRAGTTIRLRKFQQRLLYRLLSRNEDNGLLKHRAALIGVARKNGKSAKGSGLVLYVADQADPGSELYICAADRKQAGIVGNSAKAMVRMDPYLNRRFKIYRDELVIPKEDVRISILSSDAATKDGYDPVLVMFDEVHAQPNAELWDAMALGMGARVEPLMVGITTAGKMYDRRGEPTMCHKLYEYGKQVASGEVDDPTFLFDWWEPSKGTRADHLSEQTWAEANPGLGDLVSLEDLRSVSTRTDEMAFRTKRCNQFVATGVAALPAGVWDSRKDLARPESGEVVVTSEGRIRVPVDWLQDSVLFLDGSWNGDSTAAVGCTRDGFLFVVAHYEKRNTDNRHWRVPVNSVKADIRACMSKGARMLFLDPFRWQQTAADLEDEGLTVVEWHTSSKPRIVPAWKDYYTAVLEGLLSHDGNPAMSRHHENLVLKADNHGSRPVKESPSSPAHIDLAICAIGAYTNRAVEPPKGVSAWVL